MTIQSKGPSERRVLDKRSIAEMATGAGQAPAGLYARLSVV